MPRQICGSQRIKVDQSPLPMSYMAQSLSFEGQDPGSLIRIFREMRFLEPLVP
jgi:hypothetical protein